MVPFNRLYAISKYVSCSKFPRVDGIKPDNDSELNDINVSCVKNPISEGMVFPTNVVSDGSIRVVVRHVVKSVTDIKLHATDNCSSLMTGGLVGTVNMVGVSVGGLNVDDGGGTLGTVGNVVPIPNGPVGDGLDSSCKDVDVRQLPVPQ